MCIRDRVTTEPLPTAPGTYQNPVVNKSLPDPTIVKAEDGFFYLYATENIRNVPIHRSSDLVNWEDVYKRQPLRRATGHGTG